MEKIFIAVSGRGSTVAEALSHIDKEVNEKILNGYDLSGCMLETSEKKMTDSLRQYVFIQPMILREFK